MNTAPDCAPPPIKQPIDCLQPPVIIQQPIDCPLPPVTTTNQNIYVDSSVSDATLTSQQPSDSDASLSNATSKLTSDCDYSQSCGTSKQNSDFEYSRSNLTNNQNTNCPRPPIVIKECPLPPVVIQECPQPPIVIKECPQPPIVIKECPQPPIVIKECPKPPIVIKECPRPCVVIKQCPLPPVAIKECPQPPPLVIKECPRPPPVVIKESPSRTQVTKKCSRRPKEIKECSRSSKIIKECPRSSKIIKESPRGSKIIKECTRSSKVIKECPRRSKIIKESPRSSNSRLPVTAKSSSQLGSKKSSVISKHSTNHERSLSNVPSKQASSALDYSPSTVAVEQVGLLRSQSEPTLGQKSKVQSKVATVKSSNSQINFELIRSESRIKLERTLSHVLKPGLSGLKAFMSSSLLSGTQGSSFLEGDHPHLNKFIDYFIECDGLRYMGILEQIEYDFEDRVKAALLTARPNTQAEAQYLRDKLVNIGQVQPAYQQISLKEINFPELLNKEIKILSFDYKPKIDAIRRIHVYGLEMEKYWLTQLNSGKHVDKVEVYDIGTQILAELMAQLFSLLVKSCEFLMEVNEDVKIHTGKLSAESLIHLFTELRRLLVEEVGAVGETCGSVMVNIPYLKDDDIIEIMTKLYNQVNFVDICICRALKPVVPLVMLFDCQRASSTTYNYS